MTTLTADLVARAGFALYGDEWKAPLARLLDIAPRNMRRLANGDLDVPQDWGPVLLEALLASQRLQQGQAAAEVIAALGTPRQP